MRDSPSRASYGCGSPACGYGCGCSHPASCSCPTCRERNYGAAEGGMSAVAKVGLLLGGLALLGYMTKGDL